MMMVTITMTRLECFQSMAEALIQCRSFQEVHKAARTMKVVVNGFLISMPSVTAPVGSTTDRQFGVCSIKELVCTCIWQRLFVRNLRFVHVYGEDYL